MLWWKVFVILPSMTRCFGKKVFVIHQAQQFPGAHLSNKMPPRPNTLIFYYLFIFGRRKQSFFKIISYFDVGLLLFGTLGAWYAVTRWQQVIPKHVPKWSSPTIDSHHYSVLHTWITSQVELSEPKVGPADKQPSYLRKKPTSVVWLFEYIRNCVCFQVFNLFQN